MSKSQLVLRDRYLKRKLKFILGLVLLALKLLKWLKDILE